MALLLHPSWWELTTYGHPSTLAAGCFLAACAIFLRAVETGGGAGLTAGATALFAVSLLVRTDWALGAAVFPALALIARGLRAAAMLRSLAVVAIGAGLFFVSRRLLLPAALERAPLTSHASAVMAASRDVAIKQATVFVLGTGLPLAVGSAIGVGVCVVKRRWKPLLLALAAIVPCLAYWLQVIGPYRHFLLATPFALVPLAAAASGLSRPRAAALATGLMVVNEIVQLATFPLIARHYAWRYRPIANERRWTSTVVLGDWLSNHRAGQATVRLEAAEARWLAAQSATHVLVAAPRPFRIQFELIARNASYAFSADQTDSGVVRSTLETGGRRFDFIDGEPELLAAMLPRVVASERRADARLYRSTVYVPISGNGAEIGIPTLAPHRSPPS